MSGGIMMESDLSLNGSIESIIQGWLLFKASSLAQVHSNYPQDDTDTPKVISINIHESRKVNILL